MWRALDLLGRDDAFIAVNGDIWSDVDYARLPSAPAGDAHLVMVDNPAHNPSGDFALDGDRLASDGPRRLTFSGIGVYRASLFERWREVIGTADGAERDPPRFKLAPLLRAAMARNAVCGEHHCGRWTDVGTPQRLADLDAVLEDEARNR
jgi:MurNAc alpha-1-phosphate uridylyltransferase